MPPKNAPNGFYMFMLSEQKRMRQLTNRAPSMKDMPSICKDSWKGLSAAERQKYDNMAKEEKARLRNGPDRNKYRMDNQRQIIADRVDTYAEERKRRNNETQTMVKEWEGKEILDIKFFVVDFQVMYNLDTEEHKLPVEIGMVCYTLRDGITKFLHRIVDPGDVPQGNKHLANTHSENTHKIPLGYDKADTDFLGLWMQIERFLVEDPRRDEMPAVYCLAENRPAVEYAMDYVHHRSQIGEPNRVQRIYCLEDLVVSLLAKGGPSAPIQQVTDALKQNRYDYVSSIRCAYHEEVDSSYCSLSIVRRYSFVIFDLLKNAYEFQFTAQHMPVEKEQKFAVLQPPGFGRPQNRDERRGWQREQGDGRVSIASSVRPNSPPSFNPPSQRYSARPQAAAVRDQDLPRVEKFEIHLSDDEYEPDDDALHREEIKSTTDQYDLKELRKPKTQSMLQTQGAGGVAGVGISRGRGMLGRGIGPQLHGPTVSHGRGVMAFASSGYNGEGDMRSNPTVAPPPGFGQPLAQNWSQMQQQPQPVFANPLSQPAMPQPGPPAVIRARGRGRGAPPQIMPGFKPTPQAGAQPQAFPGAQPQSFFGARPNGSQLGYQADPDDFPALGQ